MLNGNLLKFASQTVKTMTSQALKNEDGFDLLIADGICLACFDTPWSAPCRAQVTILDRLDRRYGKQIKLIEVNIDRLERLRHRFDVHHIPTLVLFYKGAEYRRMVGVHPESELCRAIDEALERR